ncbi:hypothetical protein [Endozoicomonas sp. 8E]|uniref:hypothetical protein n=1 Tax=Endozoicomonas sp. 8E TaxID=3035692 RepID=UPI002939422C|nr:hypothetical protein [Endozoicomonas sp. 8E]WOG27022.1 hypothetical protein P6910_21090 [Endozoicomonas sp. 8E]
MMLSFFVVCQADPWTEPFIIEFEQNTGSPLRNFSIKPDRQTLPGSPSGIAHTNGYTESDSLPDEKRQRPSGYGVKKAIIESISWQCLYTRYLLVGYELILTDKDTPLDSISYSWLAAEVVVAIGWLLKSYWKRDSPLFNPFEQQEAISMLTQGCQPFSAITMTFGSRDNQQQYQPTESSQQQASQASNQSASDLNSLQYSNSGDDNKSPEQNLHTLGLNCFVHPCHGVCKLQQSSASNERAEFHFGETCAPIQTSEAMTEKQAAEPEAIPGQRLFTHLENRHYLSCIGPSDSAKATHSEQKSLFKLWNDFSDIYPPFYTDQLFEPQPHDINGNLANSINSSDGVALDGVALDGVALDGVSIDSMGTVAAFTTFPAGSLNHEMSISGNWPSITDDFSVIDRPFEPGRLLEENIFSPTFIKFSPLKGTSETQENTSESSHSDQSQPHLSQTGLVGALLDEKNRINTGQKTCHMTVVAEYGKPRPCGLVFKNARSLSVHRYRDHSEEKICNLTVVGKEGQKQPCGKICKNNGSLLDHKSKKHSGKKTCGLTIVGEDGQQQPCGEVCKNARILMDHKKIKHTGRQTCKVILVSEDGQQLPCGKTCKNVQALYIHKSNYHGRQQACGLTLVSEDGQQRPCGTVCKNPDALAAHKRMAHTAQQSCDVQVVGKNGQPRPCGIVFKNLQSLSSHKSRIHSGHQTCDVTVVGKDGQPRPCGKICKNAGALSNHKIKHRKRKPVDVDQGDDLSHPESKQKK